MNTDFGNSTSSLVAYILRNTDGRKTSSPPSDWTTLPSNTTNGRQYGAFLGYNLQWDQLVIGFDLAYNRLSSLERVGERFDRAPVVTTSDNTSTTT